MMHLTKRKRRSIIVKIKCCKDICTTSVCNSLTYGLGKLTVWAKIVRMQGYAYTIFRNCIAVKTQFL